MIKKVIGVEIDFHLCNLTFTGFSGASFCEKWGIPVGVGACVCMFVFVYVCSYKEMQLILIL